MNDPSFQPRAGTLVLDGLLEGPFPPTPGTDEKLRAWPEFARAHGFGFSIQIEGGNFSLLADRAPVERGREALPPQRDVVAVLESLLEILPSGHRTRVTSTLRSVEYAETVKRETVYAVDPDGNVKEMTRESPWSPTKRSRTPLIIAGTVALAVGILVSLASGLFGEPPEFIRKITASKLPEPHVTTLDLEDLLDVEIREVRAREIVLSVRRRDECPRDLETYEKLRGEAKQAGDARRWRALEAAFLGRLVVEYIDANGRAVAATPARLAAAWEREELTLTVPRGARDTDLVIRPD